MKKFETILEPKQDSCLDKYGYNDWRITDFVRDLSGDGNLKYVIQPLVKSEMLGDGFTGLTAYVLTLEELKENFIIKKED